MNPAIKYYLAAYNLIAFFMWVAYLLCFISAGFVLTPPGLCLLCIAQGMAILEIFHAAMKWVKSPVLSTAAQVFSRVLVVVLIFIAIGGMECGQDTKILPVTHIGIITVSIAWGITELVRYSFYFLSLFDMQPPGLLWMRYSFFILLYPIGVTGEWLIIITPLIAMHFAFSGYMVFVIFLLASYGYYFPVLYSYMWKQRKARLA